MTTEELLKIIRAEIERRKDIYKDYFLNEGEFGDKYEEGCELLAFLDTLQERIADDSKTIEPSKKEKMLYDLNRTLVHFWIDNGHPDNATRIELLERMLHWYKNQGTITLDEKQQSITECNDLDKAAETLFPEKRQYVSEFGTIEYIAPWASSEKAAFKAGAEWGEKNAYKTIMKKADEVRDKRFDTDYEVKFEPAAGFDLGCVNVYHEGKLVGQYVEPKKEKKSPDGLDEAADTHIRKVRDTPGWDWTTQDIAEAFKAGAAYEKAKMLEEAKDGYVSAIIIHNDGDEEHYAVTYANGERPHSITDKVKIIIL